MSSTSDPPAPTAYDVWSRVAVIGSTGAGKSTLARQLATRLQSVPVELDSLYFGPDWTPRPEAALQADVGRALSAERWIADGNYRLIRDIVWGRATAVVWLDYSLGTCLGRTLRRSVRRAWTGERICGDNRESFRKSFASRDSILLWVVQTHAARRRETPGDLQDPRWAPLHAVRLRSPREADAWLASLPAA